MSTAHDLHHRDYSQLCQLVRRYCVLDGAEADLADVVRGHHGAEAAALVSHEGALSGWRLPGVPPARAGITPVPPSDSGRGTILPPDTEPAPAPEPRMLRLGDKGPDVADWQRQLISDGYGPSLAPYGADGDFGKRTHNATLSWQSERGLPRTGVVDAATRAAVGTSPIAISSPPTSSWVKPQFIQARHYTPAGRTAVDLVVIHTAEMPEASTAALRLAQWASGPSAPQASWHYGIDDQHIVQCVREHDVAWAAPGANRNGIQLEHAGYARQSAEEWDDAFSRRMLALSAQLTARICKRWSIPVRYVGEDRLGRGARGITTHRAVSLSVGRGRTNHMDPGRYFPMERYVAMVREALAELEAAA